MTIKRGIAATVWWTIAMVVVGCSDAGSGTGDVADATDDRAGWPKAVRFGLVPSEGGTDIVERFEPLVAYLEQALGIPVDASSATEYSGIITALRNKQLEVAYLGPKSYVEAERIADVEAIIMEVNADGFAGYHSLIVAREDSGLTTLEDTRGQDFAFVSPSSTSGFLVPSLGIYTQTGELPENFFSTIVYTGSHGSSVQAVLKGDVTVAATNDLDLDAMANAGHVDKTRLTEIWRSERIPGAPIAVRRDLPASFKKAVQDAFVRFSEERKPELEAMSRGGFVTTDDGAYNIVRLLEQRKADLSPASAGRGQGG